MLKSHVTGKFDQRLTFQTNTRTNQDGSWVDSWANTYTDIPAKELRARGGENFEGNQQVAKDKREWQVRVYGNTYTTEMRVSEAEDSTRYYYITNVRRYQGDRSTRVIEAEYRDNV